MDTNKNSNVEHPEHYSWFKKLYGIEPIDIARHMNFDLGNVIKYVMRAGHKHEQGITDLDKEIEDLEKAMFYLNDRITVLKEERTNRNLI